jgi:hypothetical protein
MFYVIFEKDHSMPEGDREAKNYGCKYIVEQVCTVKKLR